MRARGFRAQFVPILDQAVAAAKPGERDEIIMPLRAVVPACWISD
jgi:hypothetical protein